MTGRSIAEERPESFLSRKEIALVFGVTDRAVSNWLADWRARRRPVREEYEETPHGRRLLLNLDDVTRHRQRVDRSLSAALRSYVVKEPIAPPTRPEEPRRRWVYLEWGQPVPRHLVDENTDIVYLPPDSW